MSTSKFVSLFICVHFSLQFSATVLFKLWGAVNKNSILWVIRVIIERTFDYSHFSVSPHRISVRTPTSFSRYPIFSVRIHLFFSNNSHLFWQKSPFICQNPFFSIRKPISLWICMLIFQNPHLSVIIPISISLVIVFVSSISRNPHLF